MRLLLIALAALLICTACPQRQAKVDQAGAVPVTQPGSAAPPAGEPAPANTADESAQPGPPPADPLAKYNMGGVYFGMTPQQFTGLFPEGGLLKTQIKEYKTFGVHEITVAPADGAKDRDMYAAFVDGALVHFTRRDPLDEKLYAEMTADLSSQYGPPTASPPAFCDGNPYFKGFSEQSKKFAKLMFWSDPQTLCVLSAMTWPEKHEMHFLLFNPRLYELLGNRMSQAQQPH